VPGGQRDTTSQLPEGRWVVREAKKFERELSGEAQDKGDGEISKIRSFDWRMTCTDMTRALPISSALVTVATDVDRDMPRHR
jgi:hypothetical protein